MFCLVMALFFYSYVTFNDLIPSPDASTTQICMCGNDKSVLLHFKHQGPELHCTAYICFPSSNTAVF